jgi:tRNA(Ile)-lysidine synthetase, N-terminal domain/tRNA(Ile)-lysidine synthetase, C-terminal domain
MKEAYTYLTNKIKTKEKVVIAVSGGPDSMALLHMLSKIKKEKNIEVICAHVNHNVREESKKEKLFVEEFCKKHDVIFEYMVIEDYGDDNFHNEARTKRYYYFNEILSKYGAKYLLTAHHGDDLMETILMRIVRGSTLRGYSGFSKEIKMEKYTILRPLIEVTKEDVVKYNMNFNVRWMIDNSNDKDIYTRNRFRKYIIPEFKKEEQVVHQKFYKFSKTLLEYNNYIDKEVKEKLSKLYKNKKMNIELFKKEEQVIGMKIIYFMLEEMYEEDLMLITDKHAELIYNLIYSKKSNLSIHLPNNIKAVKSYNEFYLINEEEQKKDYEIEIINFVNLPNGHNIQLINKATGTGNDICRLDTNEVALPLYVRNKKDGDKITIKNLNGRKKISDIFINEKVNLIERETWPVVVDAKENIVWLPGLKKSKFDKSKIEKYDIILKYY